jgi:hypothetical protein
MSGGWLGLDWGDVPTWIGSVLTGAGALIAAITYRRSVLENEKKQASRIAAYMDVIPPIPADYVDPGLRFNWVTNHKRILKIYNRSDASVYDVTLYGTFNKSPLDGVPKDKVIVIEQAAGSSTTMDATWPRTSYVGPIGLTKPLPFGITVYQTQANIPDEPAPDIKFRDAVGRWWRISSSGDLKLLGRRRATYRTFRIKAGKFTIFRLKRGYK